MNRNICLISGENFLKRVNKFYCETCSVTLDLGSESIEDHCRSKEHYESVCKYINNKKVSK